jgi:hypothetical protein
VFTTYYVSPIAIALFVIYVVSFVLYQDQAHQWSHYRPRSGTSCCSCLLVAASSAFSCVVGGTTC